MVFLAKREIYAVDINQHIMNIARKESPETVEQLIKLVQLKHPTPEQEIMKHILHLQNQGKLALRNIQPRFPAQ